MSIPWKFWKKKENESDLKRDEMIRNIMQKSDQQDLDYLISQTELNEPCAISADFEARMEQLFRSHETELESKEKKQKKLFTRYPRMAIIASCVILLSVVFIGIQTEAIPFPKFNYTKEKDDSSYAYLLEQEKIEQKNYPVKKYKR